MEPDEPFGYVQWGQQQAWSPGNLAQQPAGTVSPQASPQSDDAGTPRAPRLPVEGRATRICPGAPRKGKAPSSYFDHLSGEAPVRRLSFGAASSGAEDDGCLGSDSMDEDVRDEQQEHLQQQQQQPEQPLPQQRQQQPQQQLLPQAWLQHQPQHQPQHQHVSQLPPMPQQQLPPQQAAGVQAQPRQLFTHSPAQQRSPLLRSPQQLFMSLQQPLQPQQQQQQSQLWQPLSPSAGRSGNSQPSLTPARLFR